jgi:hypothetical protein
MEATGTQVRFYLPKRNRVIQYEIVVNNNSIKFIIHNYSNRVETVNL